MTSAIEQIDKDLAVISDSIQALAEDLRKTDADYLSALGNAVRQQFILACYYLCTQGYPKSFLKLSFSERQDLQQGLQRLAQQTEESLKELSNLGFSEIIQAEKIRKNLEKRIEQQGIKLREQVKHIEEHGDKDDDEFQEMEPQEIQVDFNAIKLDLSVLIEESLGISETSEEEEELSGSSEKPVTPEIISRWQEHLEMRIHVALQNLSRDANLLLQKFSLLPKRLPEKVLEVASKVEPPQEALVGPPNLLQFMVETDNSETSDRSKMTQLMAVHLRLSEIEFTDATVSTWRSQLRVLLGRLNSLKRDYRKKQRERAILEAEAAWRSSWFNQ